MTATSPSHEVALKLKRLSASATLPRYATDGAACFDLCADAANWSANHCAFGVEIRSGESVTFKTGLAFEVPEGHVMLVFSRSGHGFNHGVSLANCVGVIDSDYRGEVMVKLTADKRGGLTVHMGDRIAQAMVLPIPRVALEEVDALSDTARGTGGLGSTGA